MKNENKNIIIVGILLVVAAVIGGLFAFASTTPYDRLAAFPQGLYKTADAYGYDGSYAVTQGNNINVTLQSIRYTYPPVKVDVYQKLDNTSLVFLGSMNPADFKCQCKLGGCDSPHPNQTCINTVETCAALSGSNHPDRVTNCWASKLFTPTSMEDSQICLKNPEGGDYWTEDCAYLANISFTPPAEEYNFSVPEVPVTPLTQEINGVPIYYILVAALLAVLIIIFTDRKLGGKQ
jgi:hypothetical protein